MATKPVTKMTVDEIRQSQWKLQERMENRARKIFHDTLPSTPVARANWGRTKVPETPWQDIAVGHVLAIHDGYRGQYQPESIADYATSYGTALYVVVRRTAASLWVARLNGPEGGFREGNPLDRVWPEASEYDDTHVIRQSVDRHLVSLGSLEDLQKAWAAHPKTGLWLKDHTRYLVLAAEADRRDEIRWAAEEEAEAEATAKVETLNKAIGFKVYETTYRTGHVGRTDEWAKIPTEALQVLLASRNRLSETRDLFDEVEKNFEVDED